MSSYFMQQGQRFTLTDERAVTIHPTLPRGVYEVMFDMERGFFMVPRNHKPLPTKVYGSLKGRAERILQTYRDRAAKGLPTGVLLAGEKGSGKTLLANYLIATANLPTVVVSAPFTGPSFLTLLTAGGPKIVLFDEFEKVYKDENDQAALLSMLDGHYATHNLTIATLNDSDRIVDALKNRPSRFYYHYRYTDLEKEFIREYCVDRLTACDEAKINDILSVTKQVRGFNFDMLQSLVEEMNRYGDSAQDCMKHINIVPATWAQTYEVKAFDIKTGEEIALQSSIVRQNAYTPQEFEAGLSVAITLDKNGTPIRGHFPGTTTSSIYIGPEQFTGYDDNKAWVYENEGTRCIVKNREQRQSLHWSI